MFSVSSSKENMTIDFECSDWCGIEQGTTHECKVRKIMSVSENLKEREACEGCESLRDRRKKSVDSW